MILLSAFFLNSFAEPLTCAKIQELNDSNPVHIVQREIQTHGMEESTPECLNKKGLSELMPKADADLISPEHYTALVDSTKGTFL